MLFKKERAGIGSIISEVVSFAIGNECEYSVVRKSIYVSYYVYISHNSVVCIL